MKNYKNFDKISIGTSDIASLTVVTPREDGNLNLASSLHFGADGSYSAYLCAGDVEIGEHYRLVTTGCEWLKIYDDDGLVLDVMPDDDSRIVDIYRGGDMGCVIHWRRPRNAEEAARYGYDYANAE